MSPGEPNAAEPPGHPPMAPEEVLQILRKVGLGLLRRVPVRRLGRSNLARWRRRAAMLQYKVVPDTGSSGAVLTDVALELLDSTSSRASA